MSYQAVIRNVSGDLVINSPVKLRMILLQGSIEGTEVYSEIHTATTNTNGLITLEIGGGAVISGVFETIDWSDGPYFIKREVDPDGGSNYTIVGTSQLLSVPYAMYANVADTVLNLPDTSSNNEIQELSVSTTGDTLYLSNSNYVIIPGLSDATYPLVDYDGNVYDTVHIGSQIWMAKNLRTTHLNDGTIIPNIHSPSEWSELRTSARSFYNNDSTSYDSDYGALYNHYAVETGKLCPNGWHVPSDIEWANLIEYLGGSELAAIKLKEIGTNHWNYDNGTTDVYGFTALPSGFRSDLGIFSSLKTKTLWWCNNSFDMEIEIISWCVELDIHIVLGSYKDEGGLAVRCLKD
jgi:uncharacterized protein (TIGR02145 family)